MGRAARFVVGGLAAGLLAAWGITEPRPLTAADLPDHFPDPSAGEQIFWVGGCASCHASPIDGKRPKGTNKLLLGGGLELETPYGIFRVPNISQDNDAGIGSWSMIQFVNAMQRGISPEKRHYYPSFPYTSYAKMSIEDVMDLRAYLDTLPAVAGKSGEHTLGFPWSIRRGIGAWKWRYLDAGPVVRFDTSGAMVERGRYLVEGAGHCGECHTRRDRFGGMITTSWLAGGPNPDGPGRIPNITPGGKDVSDWSASDIAYYLESGFTPEYDTVGGSMVAVQENLAMLPPYDRAAIAAYLKAIAPVQDQDPTS